MYKLHFRRYAPFASFGLPRFKGDVRTEASVTDKDTYKTSGVVPFTSNGTGEIELDTSGTEMSLFGFEIKGRSDVTGSLRDY